MKKKILVIIVIAVLAAGAIGVLRVGALTLKEMQQYSGPTLDLNNMDLEPYDAIGEPGYGGPEISSVKSTGRGKLKVTWKPVWDTDPSAWTGYHVEYSKASDFRSDIETVEIPDNTIMEITLEGLDSGIVYYVRIATYNEQPNGIKCGVGWSKVRSAAVE